MKNILYTLIIAATICGCTKNEEYSCEESFFTASFETNDNTKMAFDKELYAPVWRKGDKIAINGYNVAYIAMEDGPITTFQFYSNWEEKAPYTAYYPADQPAQLPTSVTKTWDDNEKWDMPMRSYSTNRNFVFRNLCGVIRLHVDNTQMDKVKSITVSSWDRAIAGRYSMNGYDPVLQDPYNTSKTYTVTYREAVDTGSEGKDFYLPIPPATYHELRFTISDGTNSKRMTTVENKDVVIERSVFYDINFFADRARDKGWEYVPSLGGNIRWVRLWPGGPKWADRNISVDDLKTEGYGRGGSFLWGGIVANDSYTDRYNHEMERLTGSNDTATFYWGDGWRMPTKEEMEGLVSHCTRSIVPNTDNDQVKYTGKYHILSDYRDKSIILSGNRNHTPYWTSDPGKFYMEAYALKWDDNPCVYSVRIESRYVWCLIRPVFDK